MAIPPPPRLPLVSALKESNSASFSLSSPVKLLYLTLFLTPQKLKLRWYQMNLSDFSERGPNGEAVLHVAYKDGSCGEKWGDVLKLPKAMVDDEIHRALEYKFKRTIPRPISTVYQYWNEGAW